MSKEEHQATVWRAYDTTFNQKDPAAGPRLLQRRLRGPPAAPSRTHRDRQSRSRGQRHHRRLTGRHRDIRGYLRRRRPP